MWYRARMRIIVLVCGAACAPEPVPEAAPPSPETTEGETAEADTDCTPYSEWPYDGRDQDCDGEDLVDVDGDGYPSVLVEGGTDCDDGWAGTNPGAVEVCDGIDQNCDGVVDEGILPVWYADLDGDGFGNPDSQWCAEYADTVLDGTDCLDLLPTVHPGAEEVCDGWDNDCDGVTDPGDVDADADGQPACAGDCDDAEPRVAVGNAELCGDGLDNDCDGTTDAACADEGCEITVPTDVATIQGAIDQAASGDTICVEPGTYAESLDFGGKAIAVVGTGGREVTRIEVGDGLPTVTFQSGEGRTSVFKGFKIFDGDAVWISDASPTLVDVEVAYTSADVGGGIGVWSGAPALWGVVVLAGRSVWGQKEYGDGGGILLAGGRAVLDDVLVERSSAGSAGGGIEVNGGAPGLSNVVIRDNSIGGAWGEGGGLAVYGGLATLTNVVVIDNGTRAGWVGPPGGGVAVWAGYIRGTNVTVCDNDADGAGGGVWIGGSVATFTNTIICNNHGDEGGGAEVWHGAITLRYSDVWGNDPADFEGFGDPTGTNGNVSVDPQTEAWTYRLAATSPLIDAGDPAISDPDGTRSDIGAYGGPGGDDWDVADLR